MYSFNDITAKGRLGKMGNEMICLDTHDTRIKSQAVHRQETKVRGTKDITLPPTHFVVVITDIIKYIALQTIN